MIIALVTLHEKCPHSAFFWSVFSRIWTEYGEIICISPYSVQKQTLSLFVAYILVFKTGSSQISRFSQLTFQVSKKVNMHYGQVRSKGKNSIAI